MIRDPLPIDSFLPGIVESLKADPCAVISAEPGAGKSTRVPPALLESIEGQILVLQPRRIAARAVAQRIAAEDGSTAGGNFVGYQIRFEKRATSRTRIIVMTEGLLARRIQSDPFLEGVGCVIIDEFHERNLHTDIALALVREIQQAVRPELRIVIMSATLDAEPISSFLGNAKIFSVPGRTHPLEIRHAARYDARAIEVRAAEAILSMDKSQLAAAPHVLVFLPGMGEIRRVASALPASMQPAVHILHSSATPEAQQAALSRSLERKIILSTNIAETSLTIDGVGVVIDSGLARMPTHDTRLGLDRLETRRISKASARQRAGRAGRSGPGLCVRLFTAEEHGAMQDFDLPEIRRLDLSPVMLTLLAYGVTNPGVFQWFESPPPAAVQRAMALLNMLNAVDDNCVLTSWGRDLAGLPLHPRLGSVFLHGLGAGYIEEAAWLCALLEADDVVPLTGGVRHAECESDPIDRLAEVLAQPGNASWGVRNGARQLLKLVSKSTGAIVSGAQDRDTVLRQALLRGFPDRVVLRRAPGDKRGLMVGGRGVQLSGQSRVIGAGLYVAVDLRERERDVESLVHSASSIDSAWLRELLPHLWRAEDTVRIDGDKLLGVRQESFAGLILSEKKLGRLPENMDASALVRAQLLARHGSALGVIMEVPEAESWLARYAFLQAHMPEADLQAPDYNGILEAACAGAKNGAVALRNILACMQGMASPGAGRLIAEHAPEYLVLPTGNRARIAYPQINRNTGEVDQADIPSASAQVQELFGLTESPRLAGGRVALVIELLSPARRPVQITRDLRSFWNGAYQEVRKELRARYPKHPWPEDPWTAPAVSVGRRRK